MPRIQLIKRDSSILELDAADITFDLQRLITSHPVPVLATRMGMDLNQTSFSIVVSGILTDDADATGGTGASFTIDASRAGSKIPLRSWSHQYVNHTAIKEDADGVEITFASMGQIDAGLGEDITIQLKNGSGSNTVATNSVIVVNISGSSNTDDIANLIVSTMNSASVKVDTATTAVSNIFTINQENGQARQLSASFQNISLTSDSVHNGELVTIRNKALGKSGNSTVTVSKNDAGQDWDNQFIVTSMKGGTSSQKMTMEDKVQDVLNMANMSAGGALISADVLTGSLIDASLDTASLLHIEDSPVVAKYVVGIRVPYESLASSTTGNRVLRQFLLPAGPGTDYSASKNDFAYDPTTIVGSEAVRPNPFLEQGVAIPAVIEKFSPSFEAGNGYWSYELSLVAIEQLVGL
jgi:hypothetical protein